MGKQMKDAIKRFEKKQAKNMLGGGIKLIERQHNRGKLTARERIDLLIDPGTFCELGSSVGSSGRRTDGRVTDTPCDGGIVGTADVHGRKVMIYAPDFTVLGGSNAVQHTFKYVKCVEQAGNWGIPVVNLLDSSGGRLGQTDVVMAGLEWQFRIQSKYSGVVPQITVLMGPCIAGGAYLPTLCDFIIMSRVSGNMWLGGPRQTQAATSEKINKNIGGADYHMQLSGSCDIVGNDDAQSIEYCRELLEYLPSSCRKSLPVREKSDDPFRKDEILNTLVADDFNETYDMHDVIKVLADNGEYLEIKDEYAKQLITCFCRFNGHVVGVAANNTIFKGSILEVNACDKYYRFLQVLDAYGIPLVNLVDTPPVVPGEIEEKRGLLRHIGKITDVYATTTVPKISVVIREAYADCGSLIMGVPKTMGADITYAWPIARFGVEASGMDYCTEYGKGIEEDAYESYLNKSREKVDVFNAGYTWTAQIVDEIILPKDTRQKIIEALSLTKDKHEELPERAKSHTASPT
ncbi:MAG: propionyl-CoA carboxylase [Desulfobacterales bacterium]|nr:propionyl-CoA carboxylase [Desulfobacterales bacterium]